MKEKASAFRYIILTVFAILATVLYLGGCGGGGGSTSTGTLKLAITDKLSDDFSSVHIAIREIRAVPAGLENANDKDPGLPVIATFSTPKDVDVMKLQFKQQLLGDITLPAGTYSQIRLILEPNPSSGQPTHNYVTLNSDPSNTPLSIDLETPSATQSGLKIKGPIAIKPGIINAFMIDFDPNTAIVQRGAKYNFKPTGIRLIQVADILNTFGSIIGNVSAMQNWSSATVSIKRRGSINDTSPIAAGRIFANYTSGKWQAPFSAFVPASPTDNSFGYKTFISANGFAVYSSATLPVTANHAQNLGEIGLSPQ